MKILITGGAGFIGSNLCDYLMKKFGDELELICFDNDMEKINQLGKSCIIYEDLRSLKYMTQKRKDLFFKDTDIVFHLAGNVSIYDCDKNRYDAFENNVLGSIQLLDLCVEYNVKKIIYAETSAIYENDTPPHNENVIKPRTIYAVTKTCLHYIVKSYNELYGLQYTGLRYFNVYGKNQDYTRTVPPLFIGVGLRMKNNKGAVVFGDENRRRDFIHVDDINSFHEICISDKRTDNQVYNLGTGESTSIIEIIDIISKIMNKEELVKETIYLNEINGEAFDIYADINKALSLGWSPKVRLIEGIIDMLSDLEKIEVENFMEDVIKNVDKIKI